MSRDLRRHERPNTYLDPMKRLAERFRTLWSGNPGVHIRILAVIIAVILVTLFLACSIASFSLTACIPREQVMPLGATLLAFALMASAIVYAWVCMPENARQDRLRTDLEAAALTDELTGLSNRRGLRVYLDNMLEHGVLGNGIHVMLVVDLNGFKAVNDHWGHDVGDALLIRVARCLLQATRGRDLCARVGGDEYVVMLHLDTAAMSEARELVRRIVERLVEEIRGTFHLRSAKVQIGVSIGIRLFKARNIEFDEMFRQADQAMYHAKANPDMDYCFHDEAAQLTTFASFPESRTGGA